MKYVDVTINVGSGKYSDLLKAERIDLHINGGDCETVLKLYPETTIHQMFELIYSDRDGK